jgi:2'-5' RNA ligase
VYQNFSQQFACDRNRVTLVKRSRQNAAPGCEFSPFHCTIIIARMRLFAGIDLSPEVVGNLEDLLRRLQPAAQINWSPPANLHITTKFIGEWPEDRLPELTAALGTVPSRAAISIAVEKLGFFPNPHAPRVFWAGVHAGEALTQLAHDTETALVAPGIAKEERAFSPHLTLARIKNPGKQPALLQAVAKLPSLDFGNFVADRFYLYRSKTAPTGSVYTKLGEFPFSK